ncbi:MAG: ABC transporter ATP-binding protein [Chloroflexota bacterium]|nr:ABC transporter ATP-binding protein [Chloroflexota bacterium]
MTTAAGGPTSSAAGTCRAGTSRAGTSSVRTSGAVSVELRHVSRRYGSRAAPTIAVDDLSFSVPAGSICALVGPSGSGKTTTLRMINRLIEPSSGEILLDGRNVLRDDPVELRRRIGYVIQQVGLLPHLTVADNVAVVPRLLRWQRRRVEARVDELLALVGLDPGRYRARYPAELSGGERQRVGVARALAADPPLLLMDEPFGAVDPIVRERLQNELLRLQEQLAKTIIFVTHDIDEAIKMGDLLAVLGQGGRLAQFGAPAEVLANPASDFVARFVGADRGLKRLSLARVRDLALMSAITARPGDDAESARARIMADPFPYLLLVDADNRPIGWLDQDDIPPRGTLAEPMAVPMSPFLDRQTTLKDALSLLLAADVMAGIVVDHHERLLGLVTLEQIAAVLREQVARPVAETAADAAAPAAVEHA